MGLTAFLSDSALKAALPAALSVKAFNYLEYGTGDNKMGRGENRLQQCGKDCGHTDGYSFPGSAMSCK